MLVITESPIAVDAAALAGKERDTLCLAWEERRWTRKRVVTTAGRTVALALPTGSVLRPGDVIALLEDWYLAIEARPERVLAVLPRDRAEAVRVAFEVGNRHFSLAIDGPALLVPEDTAMEQLLARLGVSWERREAVYDPLGGGAHRHPSGASPPTATPTTTLAAVMDDAALLSLLHFADSAFPAGGYAHSFGLERYCQGGLVTDADGVERFLLAQLEGSSGPSDATAAAAARRAMAAGDVDGCRRLDEALEAMKPARELREASRQMGRQTLRVSALLTADARLGGYLDEVNAGRAPGHHAAAFGMTAGVLGWSAEATATGYLYSTAALLVGAALRLLPMGQTEGQRVLWRLHPVIARVAREAAAREPADMWSFAPGLDVQSMLHERLDSRLFRS